MNLSFSEIPQFSVFDRSFVAKDPALEPFWSVFPYPFEGYRHVMDSRFTAPEQRALLAGVLMDQHAGILPFLPPETAAGLVERIESIREPRTFTVTCAHQPCLLTGPLYLVHKLMGTVRLADELSARFPDRRFVPVYWNGGEDHDFEEVNHLHLFGRKIEWTDRQEGPVSRYGLDTLAPLLDEVRSLLGDSERARDLGGLFEAARQGAPDYGTFHNRLVSLLFARFGLLVLDPMDARLKALAKGLFAEELRSRPSRAIVRHTQSRLERAGFRPQSHAREINLFYLGENLRRRDRLVAEGDLFAVHGTDRRFTEAELMQELDLFPERFSPNVVLRPLYQETVLPNVAFIGGGGEVAYWLERKALFEHFGMDMPVVVRRDSFLLLDEPLRKKWEKLGFSESDLFAGEKKLVERYLERHAGGLPNLDSERRSLNNVFDRIAERASATDPTLLGAVEAERTKAAKSLDQLEARLLRADKMRHDTGLGQLRGMLEKWFPEGNLQERHDNFIPFFLKHGHGLFDRLLAASEPWQPMMRVL
jgi:bacillithiol biosynthesis cysteine-adding enzyme BshC